MRLPRFSAEMSLSPTTERYEASVTISPGTRAQIQPQRCVREGNSVTCTDCSDGYCWTHTINIPTLY